MKPVRGFQAHQIYDLGGGGPSKEWVGKGLGSKGVLGVGDFFGGHCDSTDGESPDLN